MFYCNETGNQTHAQKQENGTYLLDMDGDGIWDYQFDHAAGLTKYQIETIEKKTPGFELVPAVCSVFFVLFWKRKKRR
jgi:hypothetical protein